MSVTLEELKALVKKIADEGAVELYARGDGAIGLGLDYSLIKLTGDEVELWKEVTA